MSPVIRTASTIPAPPKASKAEFNRKAAAAQKPAAKGRARRATAVSGSKKIVQQILPTFSRQMSAMLSAGMPIVASLSALEDQQENPHFKAVVTQVRASIENGLSLSEALKPFPTIFDELYVNMVRGGETGGQLAETIARIASFLEASSKLRRRVKSAMTYPVIVLCIAVALALAMIIFIVPVFAGMFADFGAELPAPTQFLVNLSNGMRTVGPIVVPLVIVGLVAFGKWKKTPAGAYALDRFVLRMPVFGELITKVASSRFARTFGQLIKSGVPILTSLEIVSGATGNKVTGQLVMEARSAVERGDTLSSALVSQTVFPKILVRMMAAGEKTGKIDEMMESIADFYDDEIESMLGALTSLIEPFLMVFLGVVVGGILIGMFMPIFKMGEIVNM